MRHVHLELPASGARGTDRRIGPNAEDVHVNANDIKILETVVEQLRGIDAVLAEIDAGVCALHLDACIAAMESRIINARAVLPDTLHAVQKD